MQETPSKKREINTIQTQKRSNPQYGKVRKGRVKAKGRKYAGGGAWSGHVQQDFGRKTAGQTWEVREKEMQEGKEVHGGKGIEGYG